MKSILSTIILCVCGSSVTAAVPNYYLTATTRIYRGDPSVLVNEDTHTDQAAVSASVSRTDTGTTATADATAGFNSLHVRSSSAATDSNSAQLLASSFASVNDRLFFKRNGQDVTTGNIAVTVYVKGVIDFQPESLQPWVLFNVTLGNSGGGTGLGHNGSYDQFFAMSPQSKTWSASEGLALIFSLSASAVNGPSALSALTDFSAGARITKISLLGSNGQPDPTVVITSSSGTVYSVAEPHSCLLALWSVGTIGFIRRRRS